MPFVQPVLFTYLGLFVGGAAALLSIGVLALRASKRRIE